MCRSLQAESVDGTESYTIDPDQMNPVSNYTDLSLSLSLSLLNLIIFIRFIILYYLVVLLIIGDGDWW